jgi:hypothetical protein
MEFGKVRTPTFEDFSIAVLGQNKEKEKAELVISPPSDCMDFFTVEELIAGIAKGSKDLGDNYEVFASKEGHIFIRPSENQPCVLRGWQIPSSGKFELRVFSNQEAKELDLVIGQNDWLVMIRGELQTKLLSFDTSDIAADQIADVLAENLSQAKNIAFASESRGIRVVLAD